MEIEPVWRRPARAEARLGAQSFAAAAGPPMRRLCIASWRNALSSAANVSRRYSERMNARFDARAEADANVWVRPDQSSIPRNAPSVSDGSFLIGQRTLAPHVTVVARRFEDMARGHLAAVHVERDRRRRQRVREDVIFEWRNQAARRADGGLDAPPGLEPDTVARFVDEVELRHVHLTGHDPLDAPDTSVIVERRPLSGTPGHHDGGIAEIVIAVQQAARVAVGPHAMKPFGQSDGVAADGILQLLLDLPGDRGSIAQPHRRVDSREQRIQAVGHPDSISSAFRQFCNPAVQPPRNLSFLYGVVIFLPTFIHGPACLGLPRTYCDRRAEKRESTADRADDGQRSGRRSRLRFAPGSGAGGRARRSLRRLDSVERCAVHAYGRP